MIVVLSTQRPRAGRTLRRLGARRQSVAGGGRRGGVPTQRPMLPSVHAAWRHPAEIAASDAGPAAGTASSSFIAAAAPLSIADLLADDTELQPHVAAFEAAAVDAELGAEMSAAELAVLLPPDTPYGHALKLRRLLADAARPRAQIPASPAWQISARCLAAGAQQGELSQTIRSMLELNIILSSLFLSVSLPYALDLPTACGDESDCRTLRSVDAVLWIVTSGSFIGAVLSAWIILVLMMSVSHSCHPQWLEDHWKIVANANGLVITGVSCLSGALSTRLLIGPLSGAAFPVPVMWAAFATMLLLSVGGGWGVWVSMSRSTFGLAWKEFMVYQVSLFRIISY